MFSPSDIFIDATRRKKEIFLLFIINFFIVLIKSLFKQKYSDTNFFDNQILNIFFSFLAIPQFSVIITYILFFFFVWILFMILKLFSKQVLFMPLLCSLMSISAIGVVAHLTIIPVSLILSEKSSLLLLNYFFYLWAIILTVWSIKKSQSQTLPKATLIFLMAAFPFVLFGWLSIISPYLMYLTV